MNNLIYFNQTYIRNIQEKVQSTKINTRERRRKNINKLELVVGEARFSPWNFMIIAKTTNLYVKKKKNLIINDLVN